MRLFLTAVVAFALPLFAVPVRVRVTTPDAKPIQGAYVAAYALTDPWSHPSAQTAAAADADTVSLDLLPGRYEVFVAANGYEPAGRRVRVEPNGANVTVALQTMVRKTGTVTNVSGAPVEGARVRLIRAPMSEQGAAHAGGAFTTTTNEAGEWTLMVPPERWFPLMIEADGYSPAYLRSNSPATDVVLQAGGSAVVRLDRLDENALVTFVEVKRAEEALIAPERLSELRAQPATAARLEWRALAPGEYRVVVRPGKASRFEPAGEIGRIVIAAGETAELNAAMPRITAPPAFTTFFLERPARELSSWSAWERTEAAPRELRIATEAAVGGTLVHIAGSAAFEDLYLLSNDEIVLPGDAPATTIHGKANARLRLQSATPDVPLARTVRLEFRDCERQRRFSMNAAIAGDGGVEFPVPVDCRALIVRVPQREALPLPLALTKGQSSSLGTHVLSAAAEVQVRVTLAPGGAPAPGAIVRATDEIGGATRVAVVAETTADASGIAVLSGLPADEELVIDARRPGSNAVGEKRQAFAAGERAMIDPLEIPQPAALVVDARLAPAVRSAYPAARITSISLRALTGREMRNHSAAPDEGGVAAFEEITAGEWRMSAIVELEETAQPIDIETVRLGAGETLRKAVEITPLVFEGEVLSDDAAARWSLAIGDPPGRHATRRRVQVGANGAFRAVLPRRDTYQITVTEVLPNGRPGETFEVGPVGFQDPARRVTIRVPSGSAVVRVRDEGKPFAGAEVTLAMVRDAIAVGQRDRNAKSDDGGVTRFHGLVAGQWIARARSSSGRAAEKIVTVADGTASEVVLDLESAASLQGVVESAGGPVPAATVRCLVASPNGVTQQSAKTDDAGRFSIELPSRVSPVVRCAAIATNGTTAAAAVTLPASARLILPAAGASLSIADWAEQELPNQYWLVAPDGRLIGLSWIAGALPPGGGALQVPMLPPGRWRLVRTRTWPELLLLARGDAATLAKIGEVEVEVGDRQTLRLLRDEPQP